LIVRDLSGLRFLVVENDYLIACHIALILKELNATVVGSASTCSEAIDLIRPKDIDAAVLDIRLQDECSFRVADALAEAGIPFVFASGEDVSSVPIRHLNAPFLPKPFSSGHLIGVLTKFVSGIRPPP
jgi:two-component SAPR family response regulator